MRDAHHSLRSVQLEETHQAWGERVREARLAKGWTITKLAHEVGVHDTTIHRIEKSDLVPNDALKWRIAAVFQVRMDWLWAWPTVVPPALEAAS